MRLIIPFVFQSTLPAWGETPVCMIASATFTFQSTLPAWGETRRKVSSGSGTCYFNPLSPRGERQFRFCRKEDTGKFQSTLPAWGETSLFSFCSSFQNISIHSPRVGRDFTEADYETNGVYFNPLSPRGERLRACLPRAASLRISIHSPRVGRDLSRRGNPSRSLYFNPLSPRGERQRILHLYDIAFIFQSTLPAWGETDDTLNDLSGKEISIHSPRVGRDTRPKDDCQYSHISIHSPRVGRDGGKRIRVSAREYFNPLSPRGERLFRKFGTPESQLFQSTLPAWGETTCGMNVAVLWGHFNPLSPRGERRFMILLQLT